ncbi:MAG: transporter substrate-binding domain-containing protein [Rhodocyclales bacterium]|nr:transporter substrate-binding domain-containing protein [Rhodocyclales bacterium]
MRNWIFASWLLLVAAPCALAAPELVSSRRLDAIDLAPVTLTEPEQAFLRAHPVITLGAEASWEPYIVVAPDGSIGGYDADILTLIKRATGADIRLQAGAWREVIEATRRRELDGFSTGAPHSERADFVSFSDVYLALEKIVLVPAGNPGNIRGAADLAGKRIGIHKGNLQDEKIAARFTQSTIVPMDRFDDTIRAVIGGEVDAIFGNGASQHRALRLGFPYLQMALPLNERLDLVFSIRNDWPEALSIINKGLAAIPRQAYAQLQNYWFLGTASASDNPLPLTHDEAVYLRDKSVLRYCVQPTAMPIERINRSGEHVGITADLIKLLAGRIGIPMELVPTADWPASLEAARAKRCDLLPAVAPTPQLREYLAFTAPVLSFPLVIATRSSELFVAQPGDIGARPVGVLRDSAVRHTMSTAYPQLRLIEQDSIQDGLKQVEQGRLFGFIGLIPTIGYEIQRAGTLNVKIGGRFDDEVRFHLAVRNDEPELLTIFEKAIASVTPDEWDDMNHRWLSVRYEQTRDWTLLWQILLAVAVLGLLGLYRVHELRRFNRELTRLNQELQQLYRTDQLTGVANRYRLQEDIRHEIERANRYGQTFSVIMLDIDHFKEINDAKGHAAGDAILQALGALLDAQTRASDTVGRWGGEEFLLICPASELEGATQLAESLRVHIATTLKNGDEPVSASFGVAQYRPGEPADAIVQRADQAMYAAKNKGRNRVECEP